MKFNINECVFVQLTDAGREEIKRQHDELRETFPKLSPQAKKVEDKNGWSKWQLHCLMNTFGHMTHNGGQLPFNTEIRIESNAK
ncbi:MAG: hypothetical protein JKY52_19850 [Flavobacteriales bacterium]|nr:hypothetical protein [Flavobacteriales bacterium]